MTNVPFTWSLFKCNTTISTVIPQISANGFNIEPANIMSVFLQHSHTPSSSFTLLSGVISSGDMQKQFQLYMLEKTRLHSLSLYSSAVQRVLIHSRVLHFKLPPLDLIHTILWTSCQTNNQNTCIVMQCKKNVSQTKTLMLGTALRLQMDSEKANVPEVINYNNIGCIYRCVCFSCTNFVNAH